MSTLDQITPLANVADYGSSYLPTASSSGTGFISDVAKTVANLGNEIGGVSLEVPGNFSALIEAQLQAQMEMQTVSMVSNIERSKHETKMVALRNIKLS